MGESESSLTQVCNILESYGCDIVKHTEDTFSSRPERKDVEPLEVLYRYEDNQDRLDLRDYQKEALKAMSLSHKGILNLPTGTGKTLIFLSYIKSNPGRYIIVVPSKQLQGQTIRRCKSMAIPCARFRDGMDVKSNLVIVGIYNSCGKMVNLDVDCIIFDEAHNSVVLNRDSKEDYSAFQKLLNHPCKCKYFFTATMKNVIFTEKNSDTTITMNNPEIYGPVLYRYGLGNAISDGYLMDYRIKVYNCDNKEQAILDFISERRARKLIIFCSNLDKVSKLGKRLKGDFSVFCLDEKADTEKVLKDFREHTGVSVLITCKRVREGYDEPAVDAIIHYDLTSSSIELIQKNGRALRLHPEKTMSNIVYLLPKTKDADKAREQIRKLEKVISYMKEWDNRLHTRISKCRIQRADAEKLFDIHGLDGSKQTYNRFWEKLTGETFGYAQAKLLLAKQRPRIETKEAYYALCEEEKRLPRDPREEFKCNFDWCDYLGLDREDYYGKEECKNEARKYSKLFMGMNKVNLIETCREICKNNTKFPPYDLWLEFYNETSLSNLIIFRRRTKKK
jgi:superfamily II DNA or RNA helicase